MVSNCCDLVHSDGVVHCSGSMETAAVEPAGAMDGREHHLPIPDHDGGHDAGQAVPSYLQLQRRWASIRTKRASRCFTVACFPVFKKLSGDQAILQMAVYLLANLVGIGLGVYKVNAMGLLPTSQSDWLEFMVVREVSYY